MPHLLKIPALLNHLLNLSTVEKHVEIFLFCIGLARDQMLLIKIEYHGIYYFEGLFSLNISKY